MQFNDERFEAKCFVTQETNNLSIALSSFLKSKCAIPNSVEDINAAIRPIFEKEFWTYVQFIDRISLKLRSIFYVNCASGAVISKYILNFLEDTGAIHWAIKYKVPPLPKPPLGIQSKKIWKETRIRDLADCLARTKDTLDENFLERSRELAELVDDLVFDEKIK